MVLFWTKTKNRTTRSDIILFHSWHIAAAIFSAYIWWRTFVFHKNVNKQRPRKTLRLPCWIKSKKMRWYLFFCSSNSDENFVSSNDLLLYFFPFEFQVICNAYQFSFTIVCNSSSFFKTSHDWTRDDILYWCNWTECTTKICRNFADSGTDWDWEFRFALSRHHGNGWRAWNCAVESPWESLRQKLALQRQCGFFLLSIT